jgi:3-phenylpropionate/trans-cinnamate dioxygenase ferredoxin reductase subunit
MSVVIIGSGMAGMTVAMTLRARGYTGTVVVVGEEDGPPYQRPPLSKEQLVAGGEPQLMRPAEFWSEKTIELLSGVRAVAIDREARSVELDDGRSLEYEHLVLATGARNRELAGAPGAFALRTLEESRALRQRLTVPGARLVVVGGGFIGLEVAAAARTLGADVAVVEALDRVMARVVSVPMSRWFEQFHTDAGVRLLLSRRVEQIDAAGVQLDGGERLDAEAALVAVGVTPNTELGETAGLAVDDGVVVDEHLTTSDPAISAVGDCARFPGPRGHHRLESVQNASDHARAVAARITGEPAPYRVVPWFWSDQLGHKLQIVGIAPSDAVVVPRGEPSSNGFSLGLFHDDELVAVEAVDCMADYMAARKLLTRGVTVTVEQFADPEVSLDALIARP